MHVLFISHSFPPIVGGVENQNYNLSKGIQELAQVTLIANRKGKKWLPFFSVWALIRGLVVMQTADVCLTGSGVLSPIAFLLRLFYPNKRFFCVVHGLDITFAKKRGLLPWIYKKMNIPALNAFDRLIMVGRAAIEEGVSLGIRREQCVFVPNGVNVEDFDEPHDRSELSALLGEDVQNKKVILRLGRFTPHKGTGWFIENVMPHLPEDVILAAAGHRVRADTPGDPDDFVRCQRAVAQNQLETRVRLLPSIPLQTVKILLNTVDLVIAPNIRVPGSMEGFGLNVLEACACRRVVVASRLEGLRDAVKEGVNGFLVEPGDVKAWVSAVTQLLSRDKDVLASFGEQARRYVQDQFSWSAICKQYVEIMGSTVSTNPGK